MKTVTSISLLSITLAGPLVGCALDPTAEEASGVRKTTQEQNATASATITVGSHDVEERQNGSMYLNSSDLELGLDGSNAQVVGLRFENMNIPAGAIVSEARLSFQVDEVSTGPSELTIRGEDTDHATPFSSAGFDVSRRARTTARVEWSPASWTTVGATVESPNLAPVVQEIVNRPGWASGQALSLKITGSGRRTAESAEGGAGPQLTVVYQLPEDSLLSCNPLGCKTLGGSLPNNLDESVYFDNCGDGGFSWTADYSFEPGYDYFSVNDDQYDGWDATASGRSDGPAVISVKTDFIVQSDGLNRLSYTCDDGESVSVFLEAECPNDGLTWDLHDNSPSSSRDAHIEAPNASYRDKKHSYRARTSADQYKLYFRVDPHGSYSDDSWYYTVDNGPEKTINNLGYLNGWNWVEVETLDLTADEHTIDVYNRESGLSMDKIALLPSSDPAPSGEGQPAYNCTPDPSFTCNDHAVCGDGHRCVFEFGGNNFGRVRCIQETEMPYDSVWEICESPTWSGACPADHDCTGMGTPGYKYCEPVN